jgi:hypothetical protein
MSWRAAALTSLLVILARPATWVAALAAFLVRGGLLLFILPIVILPTPVGLANIVAPTLTSFVFGGISPSFIVLVGAISGVILAWLVLGGLIAAMLERWLIVTVARDEEVTPRADASAPMAGDDPPGSMPVGVAWQILAARMIASVPLAVALAWSAARVVDVSYRELTVPSDVVTPIVLRVARAVPDALAAIAATWIFAEGLGALAARLIVLDGRSLGWSLLGATAHIVRHPLASVATFVVPAGAFLGAVTPVLVASALTWDRLRTGLVAARAGDEPTVLISLLLFIVVWAAGLVVTGLLGAWRNAVWTGEILRIRGTIGVAGSGRTGDWNSTPRSGTL